MYANFQNVMCVTVQKIQYKMWSSSVDCRKFCSALLTSLGMSLGSVAILADLCELQLMHSDLLRIRVYGMIEYSE